MNEEALRLARAYADEVAEDELELLRTLARIPSPSHHEERRAEFVRAWLLEAGAAPEQVHIDDAKNMILDLSCGHDELAVFSAHTDVVFPDEDELPLAEDDERMCAPGVGDDTANLVGLLFAARWLLRNKPQLKHGVLIVANSCEEGLGNLAGTREIFRAYGDRIRQFVSFDLYLGSCVTHAVGSERWRVTARTQGGHSWEDFGRPNAVERLCAFIEELYALPLPSAAKTSVNVGRIEGGGAVNAIASSASALIEYRSAASECLVQMREQVAALANSLCSDDVTVDFELIGERPASRLEEPFGQTELVDEACAAIRAVTGGEPRIQASSTDANIPLSLGIPAVCVGAIVGGLLHTRDEWIEKKSLSDGLTLIMCMVLGQALE